MKGLVMALAALVVSSSFSAAGTVKIVSPDRFQTYAFGEVLWHSLEWNSGTRSFQAAITFSNRLWASTTETRVDDSFVFDFPDVKLDPASGVFYAHDKDGRRVPVAAFKQELFVRAVKPLPGTVVHIFKRGGEVTVVLSAGTDSRAGSVADHWVEHNEAGMLQRLVDRAVDY